jgi:flagellar biosynthesis protein FlhA
MSSNAVSSSFAISSLDLAGLAASFSSSCCSLAFGEINQLIQATSAKAHELLQKGVSPVVIIVDPQLRRGVAEIFERFSLDVVTLSHAEIDSSATFEVMGSISIA